MGDDWCVRISLKLISKLKTKNVYQKKSYCSYIYYFVIFYRNNNFMQKKQHPTNESQPNPTDG